jgi:POT family proton-dependent oligopeptide transporter
MRSRKSAITTGLPAIVMAAALQRTGHFGIKSLLIVYLTTVIVMSDHHSGQAYGLFYGSFFLASLLGGAVGDRTRDYFNIGSLGLLLMLAGQIGLSLGALPAIVISLIISSLGFGLFDPNMNAIIAQQCGDDERRRDAAYRAVYIAINVGAMLGPLVCGYIAVRVNPRYGFIAGAFFSFLSFLLFRSATRSSASSDARDQEQRAAGAAPASSGGGQWRRQWLLLTMFALLGIVFWGVFDQLASSVTLLTERYVHRTFWSFEIPAGYVQSINPFLVILLGPLFAFLAKRKPNSEKPQREGGMMLLGLVLLAAGFGVLALGTVGVGTVRVPGSIGWSWIWGAILLSTVGEFLYVPMSMSIAARLAPEGRRGFVFGALMATVGLGSYLSGTMAGLMNDFGSFPRFFGTSAVACCLMGVVFLVMMRAGGRSEKGRANSA